MSEQPLVTPADDGLCHCPAPQTDPNDPLDWCFRCRRPLFEDEGAD